MSSSTLISIAIHSSATAIFGYALYHDLFEVHIPPELVATGKFKSLTAFPGRWKFLTIWNLVLQLVYHSFSLINDFVGTNELNTKRQSVLQKMRDILFASWVFPTGIFVSLSFWTLFAIDRELVFPAAMDTFFPSWLNHAVHTGPILFLTIESYCVPKIYPSKALGIFSNIFFTSCYSSCMMLMDPRLLVGSFGTELYNKLIPFWKNHVIHSIPFFMVLLELVFVPHSRPSTFLTGGILFIGAVIYVSWLVWVNYYSGVWAYPILEILDTTSRCAFIGGAVLIIFAFYFLGEGLAKWRWGSKGESSKPKGKAAGKPKKKTK